MRLALGLVVSVLICLSFRFGIMEIYVFDSLARAVWVGRDGAFTIVL